MARASTRRIDRVRRSDEQHAPRRKARGRTLDRKPPAVRGGAWKEELLREYKANGGCILYACETVGIHPSTFHRARQQDEEFAVAFADARDYAVESLEREAHRRALDGSDLLIIFLLKANRPHVYRDNYKVPVALDEDQLTTITSAMQEALGKVDLTPQQEREFLARLESGLKGMEEA